MGSSKKSLHLVKNIVLNVILRFCVDTLDNVHSNVGKFVCGGSMFEGKQVPFSPFPYMTQKKMIKLLWLITSQPLI